MDETPWRSLPAPVIPVLRPVLPGLVDEVILAVRTIPAYARPMEGAFGAGVRAGVESAFSHFLAEVQARGPVERPDVYEQLGRGEMRAGRTLDSLLAAYRMGARVAWRRFNLAGIRAGLDAATLGQIAEAIFAYIDVLSAESAAGHAAEQSLAAGEAAMRRRRLVRLLVREPPVDANELEVSAASAAWRLPRSLSALALDGPGRERAVTLLPGGALAETIGGIVCAIVPDAEGPGRRAAIARAVATTAVSAGLGTPGGWQEAPASFTRARAALMLAQPGELVSARERAGELLLASDPGLGRALVEERLAPLLALGPGARARATATLTAWLAEQGRVAAVAARLGMHPQTARYRIGRLRELFGPALEDPEQRFWLGAALRTQAAAEGAGAGSGAGSGANGTSGPSSPAAISSDQK